MEDKSKGILFALKEVMKLPVDKETNTINVDDVKRLVNRISKEIPEADVAEFLEEYEAQKSETSE